MLSKAKRLLLGPNRVQHAKRFAKRWLRKVRTYQLRDPIWTLLPQGFWMELDPDPAQIMDRMVLIEGVYDPALTMLIQQYVQTGDTCIDIGAHKGYVSCLLASLVGTTGMVLSFEPDPRAFSSLSQNLERNQYTQALAFPLALCAHDGFMTLMLTKTLGWTSQYPNSLAKSDAIELTTVECARFDTNPTLTSLLSRRKSLSFLKIDAEGSEPEIWQGMVETIRAYMPLISMEINYPSLAIGRFDIRKFDQSIKQAGYTEFFEPVISEDRRRPSRCILRPIDITEERPHPLETIIANPASPFYGRIVDMVE
jgi:FkbM family methyltransferase